MGCHFLLRGMSLIQRWNPRLLSLLRCRQILYHWASGEALWTYAKCWINIYWKYGKILKTVGQFTKCIAKRQQKLKISLKIFASNPWIYAFCYLFIVPILLSLHIWPWVLDFPDDSDGKEFSCNAGDLGSIPAALVLCLPESAHLFIQTYLRNLYNTSGAQLCLMIL